MNKLQELITAKHELEDELRKLRHTSEDLQKRLDEVVAQINKLKNQ